MPYPHEVPERDPNPPTVPDGARVCVDCGTVMEPWDAYGRVLYCPECDEEPDPEPADHADEPDSRSEHDPSL
jgi:hypothetical protein